MSRRSLLVAGAAAAMGRLAPARGASALPAPIAGMDYRLIFADDFDRLDVGESGHRWAPHLWYERPVTPDHYSAARSIVTIRSFRRGGAWTSGNLATEWADTRGGTFFRGGYFEARMKVPRGWPSFWLFSVDHTRNVRARAADPRTLCAEIDIFEGDSAHPTAFCGAVHRNTGGGGGIEDAFNHNNCHEAGVDLTRDFHLYGALWTKREIVWYLDRRETHRAPAFDSTWQDDFLILGLAAGGVLNGPPPPVGIDEIALEVDWVRVWARPVA
jgi:hypothetical protein